MNRRQDRADCPRQFMRFNALARPPRLAVVVFLFRFIGLSFQKIAGPLPPGIEEPVL
jgi:hypothetical protein